MTATVDLAALLNNPLSYFDHPDPAIRRLAVSAAAAAGDISGLQKALAGLLEGDPSARVRAEAAEAMGRSAHGDLDHLLAAARDPDPIVIEAVTTALGELENPRAVPWLIEAARRNTDGLVREAAVVALGAIGDKRARPVLLALVTDAPPQVRRRAVVALTVFDGPEVEAALYSAREDRNPMVRGVAEMVVGRPIRDPARGGEGREGDDSA